MSSEMLFACTIGQTYIKHFLKRIRSHMQLIQSSRISNKNKLFIIIISHIIL